KLIVVSASKKTQIERLKHRNKYSKHEALKRINSQIPTEEKIKHADFVVNNDADIKDVEKQVKSIWEEIKAHQD
nr:dephospho-CoA kinase [Candidatus Dadabacteria bacterium]